MKNEALEEINATLQYINEIFQNEKVIHCIKQFNSSNPTQKLVYAGATINYLKKYFNNVNELLNFLHAVSALDTLTKKL